LVQSAARSDEAVVFSNLKSIMTAQQTYNVSNGSYGTFNQLADGGFIDARFKGEKPIVNEYAYTITVVEKTPENATPSYSVNADPARTGDRSGRHFYIDSTSTDIHVNNSRTATAGDETLKP
jgi:Tfp pilus assembly protein PilE